MQDIKALSVRHAVNPITLTFQASGLALAAHVSTLLSSGSAMTRFLALLADTLNRNVRVAVRLTDLGRGEASRDSFIAFCHCLKTVTINTGRYPEVTVRVRDIEPAFAHAVVRRALPVAQLNLIVDGPGDEGLRRALWHLRSRPNVLAASWPQVSSVCPLLAAEPASDVLPGSGILGPPQSAWLDYELRLDRFVIGKRIDVKTFENTLSGLVETGDRRHGEQRWPSPAMQADAWMNRRLAIRLTGIGDTVCRLGLDPESPDSYHRMRELIVLASRTLRARSRDLAQKRGAMPAIGAANPCTRLQLGRRKDWGERWQRAVERSGTRQRCLLVLEPWSLFPGKKAHYAYTNLMPLLTFADALAFRRESCIRHWNFSQFDYFYTRFQAINGLVQRQSAVAEQL